MLARCYSAGLLGVDGYLVTVEADVGLGLPGFSLIGQATGALDEARERVKSALAHCGFEIRPRRQVVNLAPADMRKDSPGIDLAVACALLASHGVIPLEALGETMLWGELALDGMVRPASGTLVVADCARRLGFRQILVAKESGEEAALIPELAVVPVASLAEAAKYLRGELKLEALPVTKNLGGQNQAVLADLADVRGLSFGRMAVEIMVAGGHNLLFHGPPGVGKTMLARRAAALFPPLELNAALEVTKIHSVARKRLPQGLIQRAPVRAPHHTVTVAGLLGGGTPPHPGEVSLAHHGMLFLDELPEFARGCLEGLREPLEEGLVNLVRANYAVHLPARFQLMAAMNPCPCGYLGHAERNCVDSTQSVRRYQQKLSGPFLDRLDLVVPVTSASENELDQGPGEESERVRGRIGLAREQQRKRLADTPWRLNAQIPADAGAIDRYCPMTEDASRLLRGVVMRKRLSLRAQHRLRRVARTICDLQDADGDPFAAISASAMATAIHLRKLPDPDMGDA